jgi:hypothetical protein
MNAKAPAPETAMPPDELADIRAVADAVAAGRPVDPDVARRVRDRSTRARKELLATRGVQDIGVQLIREARGPVDAEQERELTPAQRDLLRRGERRLTDPETGKTYVLVPEDEYDRLRSTGR